MVHRPRALDPFGWPFKLDALVLVEVGVVGVLGLGLANEGGLLKLLLVEALCLHERHLLRIVDEEDEQQRYGYRR